MRRGHSGDRGERFIDVGPDYFTAGLTALLIDRPLRRFNLQSGQNPCGIDQ